MTTPNYSRKVYTSVVADVISNVKEAFLDEGVDDQVLQELQQLWENKLSASRALEPADPEPTAPGNIPFQLMQPQQSQRQVVQPGGAAVQHIQLPVQINNDGQQISNAASMAFSAQGGMFPQQMQALVNINPGAQITLQQTANGQYIIQTLPQGTIQQGVSQPQMIQLPQQTIIQNQHGQIQQIQGLPQLDGTHDEEVLEDIISTVHEDNTIPTKVACCSKDTLTQESDDDECNIEIQIDNKKLRRDLQRDLRRTRSKGRVPQLDGNNDTSSSEDDNFDDDDDDNDDEEKEEDGEGEEEEPLNSDDDVSEEDPQELFDTDNVVVCQFEKIGRNKSKWKFNLKDGIMNLDGKDHVFQKGTGEADW